MKEIYVSPKAQFVTFYVEDVITTSTGDGTEPSSTTAFTIDAGSLNRDIDFL